MKTRFNLFLTAMTLKLILISLLTIFISGSLVFAQDPMDSIESKTNAEFFIVIVTKGNPLNVRQKPSSSSPMVASLPNGSKVPWVGTNGAEPGQGNWFQIEYSEGKVGWVSSNYSRKIKEFKNTATAQATNLESNDLAGDKDVKPIAETSVEKKGFFARLFSSETKKEEINAQSTKPWANIDGFRSAKFGMKEKEVKKAIYQDFEIPDEKINTIKHPTERTESLAVTVEKLLPNAGKSRIVYVMGYKAKRLIQVNILTGHPVDTGATLQQIVDSGNLLGNYFFKKRYQEDGLVKHARLNDGSILIFRGKDQKGRMALLRLSNPQPNNKNDAGQKMSLNLSYIETPGKPDVYQLKDGDF